MRLDDQCYFPQETCAAKKRLLIDFILEVSGQEVQGDKLQLNLNAIEINLAFQSVAITSIWLA